VDEIQTMPEIARNREELFDAAISGYGPAMERLARVYEADPDARRDLLQEIHIARHCRLRRCSSGSDG
jgi:DNA-directed RNA polymerase specialized sigma24 family protein